MNNPAPLFTAFTATYNRAHLLPRVYACLRAQTFKDFEWLIVDDGSTDDTRERVALLVGEKKLDIRYVRKENGGVHTAHNLAIRLARGQFFLRCDSDDEFFPTEMETLRAAWEAIPKKQRAGFSGVACLAQDESGAILGDVFPTNPWDSDPALLASLKGDKHGFYRTDVLRQYPFPEFPGERHAPESLVWERIGERYKMRCINVALEKVHSTEGSLSKRVRALRYSCGNGFLLYYREALGRPQTLIRRLKLATNYTRTALGLHYSYSNIMASSPRKVWTLLTLPLGVAFYLTDSARGATQLVLDQGQP